MRGIQPMYGSVQDAWDGWIAPNLAGTRREMAFAMNIDRLGETTTIIPTTENRLLGAMRPDTRRKLALVATRVLLQPGDILTRCGEAIERLVFPEGAPAMLSLSTGGSSQDVGMIGRDGVVGWSRLFSDQPTPYTSRAHIQAGSAIIIPAQAVVEAANEDSALLKAILTFAQRFSMQTARTLASALRDIPERRIARLLLMIDDRIDGDTMSVTHASIAATLNLRRATVTDCLHILEGEHMVRCSRGRIMMRDRAGLEARAGLAYVADDGVE